MMLAHRLNQENVVHAQQTAGAAKTLNSAKTPAAKAPKTPFGKSALKANGQENEATVAKKGIQLDKSAFITPAGTQVPKTRQPSTSLTTPAGPRTRAPLGFKTTNAKTTAFQTPIGKTAAKMHFKYHAEYPYPDRNVVIKTARKTADTPPAADVSTRRKRASGQVPTTSTQTRNAEIEQDVEYMPPRPEPLPDVPSDDEFDIAAACETLMIASQSRGLACFGVRDEEEANRRIERDEREHKEHVKMMEEELTNAAIKGLDEMERDIREEMGWSPVKAKNVAATVETVKAKEAASVLALEPKRKMPSYAAPTTASKAHRRPESSDGKEKARHAAAVAASKSTVSYGKGRRVSAKIKAAEIDGVKKDEVKKEDVMPKKTLEQEIHEIMFPPKTAEEEEREWDEIWGKTVDPWDDLDEEVFQFTLPTLH